MRSRIGTVAFEGVCVKPIDVQVHMSGGNVAFTIVGLPDKAVAESRERVRAALHAIGLSLPPKRLIVNLAPADVSKEGSHYDLPIALGVLGAMGILPPDELEGSIALGELALDCGIHRVTGVLPAALHAHEHGKRLICPFECGSEAAWAGDDLNLIAPKSLLEVVNHITGKKKLERPYALTIDDDKNNDDSHANAYANLSQVRGQEAAKRALEVAASGGHNILMSGSPGAGKSMLAKCIPSILPPLSAADSLETSMIHSLAGTLSDGGLMFKRPYRDPHHSASLPALVGGGAKVKPGEISLAHNGVLFLDELPEFSRQSLEALRQPMENGTALIARANQHVTFPARFQLVAAMNPCKCGYLGAPERECTRAPLCGADYQSRISGPLMDRIDMYIDVIPVPISNLSDDNKCAETSEVVAKRVARARQIAQERNGCINAHLNGDVLDKAVKMDSDTNDLLQRAAVSMGLSARGYYKILRVARTIADLDDNSEEINRTHMAEALSYRTRNI